MRRSGVGSGGGIGMNKNVKVPVRTGDGSHSIRPAGVSQLGYAVGDHSTNSGRSTGYRGEKLHGPEERNFHPVPLGNELAATTDCRCGGSRTIYATGTQTTHGSVNSGNPPAKSGDILNEYGPNYRAPRS
jgi:hypothetical protein